MGFEVDTEQVLALSEDVRRTAAGLRTVADEMARVAVPETGFGGDRYQEYGAAYHAANGELADLAGLLFEETVGIADLMLATTSAYSGAESGAEAGINSSGAGLPGGGA